MAFLKRQKQDISFWRQGIQSNPETLSGTLDSETDIIIELTKPATGMWRYPTSDQHCCIYRVPHRLRRVNPEAYTPQLVLIGPLHHYLKFQALQSHEDITNTKLMGYLNMETHKKIYLAEFTRKQGNEIVEGFRRMIQEDEEKIRACYSESTSWIESSEFVKMILLDSVFILEHMLRVVTHAYYEAPKNVKTGDIVVDEPCLLSAIRYDLMLLENQLPYIILEKLFDPHLSSSYHQSFRSLSLIYFYFEDKTKKETTFRHFTDMVRCFGFDARGSKKPTKTIFSRSADRFTKLFRYGDIEKSKAKKYKSITHMYNATKLHNAGVNIVAMENEFSMDVRFENGCLKIPFSWFNEYMEIILRNMMALEQCHYPSDTRVCNFVTLLDFLIDSEKDLELLFEKGIFWTGEQKSVAKMVNKLRMGVIEKHFYYSDIVCEVNAYCDNRINMTRAILDRLYFGNLWKGTATVGAILLLVMTLIQTVASVLQVIMQK